MASVLVLLFVSSVVLKPTTMAPSTESSITLWVSLISAKSMNASRLSLATRYRQYGLWERYAELYPNEDLVYTVGTSDYKKDWFFAQVNRKIYNKTYQETTWQINFKLDNVKTNGTYKL